MRATTATLPRRTCSRRRTSRHPIHRSVTSRRVAVHREDDNGSGRRYLNEACRSKRRRSRPTGRGTGRHTVRHGDERQGEVQQPDKTTRERHSLNTYDNRGRDSSRDRAECAPGSVMEPDRDTFGPQWRIAEQDPGRIRRPGSVLIPPLPRDYP